MLPIEQLVDTLNDAEDLLAIRTELLGRPKAFELFWTQLDAAGLPVPEYPSDMYDFNLVTEWYGAEAEGFPSAWTALKSSTWTILYSYERINGYFKVNYHLRYDTPDDL